VIPRSIGSTANRSLTIGRSDCKTLGLRALKVRFRLRDRRPDFRNRQVLVRQGKAVGVIFVARTVPEPFRASKWSC